VSDADRRPYFPSRDEPDDGTNGHFGMEMTEDGRGPADFADQHHTACWCGDPNCTLFYGKVCDHMHGIHVMPHRGCFLR